MIFQDESHQISYLIFLRKLGKMSQNLSSAAVVIGVLRVKRKKQLFSYPFFKTYVLGAQKNRLNETY